MIKGILLIVAALCMLPAEGQWVLTDSIPGRADHIEIDNLNSIYKIHKSEITKYNPNNDLQYSYSDKQLGNIGSIDVSYPLRPLVVYPDLNYLVILDNTLSNNRGKVNLLDYDIGLGILACSSVQNHFWIYDAMQFALIRTDENFIKVSNTGNLAQILGVNLAPNYMVEFANKLYVNNPETGILVFDIFGTYIKTIPIRDIDDFQVFENELIYLKNNVLYVYNTLVFESREIELPYICREARIQKNELVLLTDQNILIFKKSNP